MCKDTLKMVRQTYSDWSTIGEWLVDSTHHSWNIEPTCRKIPGRIQAIPAGKYEVVMFDSARARKKHADNPAATWPLVFNFQVPLLLKVPGHEYIEIHPGNFMNAKRQDSHDCLCPGYTKDVDFVGQSEAAWISLTTIIMDRLKAGPAYVEVIGGLV